MKMLAKNRPKILGFTGSFLLHFLLLAALFWSWKKVEKQPEVTLEIELISADEINAPKKKSEKVLLKKSTHEPSDHVHLPEESTAEKSTKSLDPTFHPLPEIPEELRDEAFSSRAVARFHIGENGSVTKVELIQPCANPRLNVLLLKALQKWKFPAEANGKTQEISVTFLVR